MKKVVKRIIIGALIIFLPPLLLFIYISPRTINVENDISKYDNRKNGLRYAENVMPDLESLSKYENTYYQYRQRKYAFFYTETMLLVVTYGEETYKNELKKIEGMDFLQNPVIRSGNSMRYLIPEHEFVINDYDFKVLNDDNRSNFPKVIGLIATSDKHNSIAYLYFKDQDRDSIDNMKDFIEYNFEYKW